MNNNKNPQWPFKGLIYLLLAIWLCLVPAFAAESGAEKGKKPPAQGSAQTAGVIKFTLKGEGRDWDLTTLEKAVDPGKGLTINITNNSKYRMESKGKLALYKEGDKREKIEDVIFLLKAGESKSWSFSSEKGIKTLAFGVYSRGSIEIEIKQGGARVAQSGKNQEASEDDKAPARPGGTNDCSAFPDKLERCDAYECKFKHPFTGGIMKRRILVEEGGKCLYIEEMPNGGRMECRFSSDQRKAAAQYYRTTLSAESIRTKSKIDPSTGKTITTTIVDGKAIRNVLMEALNNGDCVILGYGDPSDSRQDPELEKFKETIFEKLTKENIRRTTEKGTIKIKEKKAPPLKLLFPNWRFFDITRERKVQGGTAFGLVKFDNAAVDKDRKRILLIQSPGTHMSLPAALKITLDEDITLKSQEDVVEFGRALIALYFKRTRLKDVESLKKNEWAVYTGAFFDHLKGFLLKVDSRGKIVDLKYSLKIKKK